MLKKIILAVFAILFIVVAGFIGYVQLSWDKTYDIGYPDLQVSTDSAVIAHGAYLVNGPAHCIGCHVGSFEDFIVADRGEPVDLKGGVVFPMGPLGTMVPPNLTPDKETGIGRYSDGEMFRMMRHAVKPNGTNTLSVMMPFWNMADDDMIAVVSYLRSLEPVKNEIPEADVTFMGKMVRCFSPVFKPVLDPQAPAKAPAVGPTVERGEYLAKYVANCVGCHTERDMMTFEATGPDFAGGMEFEPFPELHRALNVDEDLWTRSPNITPYPGGVLAKFKTEEDWIRRFRQGRLVPHSPMDWGAFAKMSDEDLRALWVYLNSLDPVAKEIGEVNFKKEG